MKLAEGLAALANDAGGRILIGVHPSGDVAGVEEQMAAQELRLLRAALSCSPPVAFAPPDLLESGDGLKVVRVLVPPSQAGPHLVEGGRPVRRGGKTVSEPAPVGHRPAAPAQPIGDLRGLIANGPTADVIMLGSRDTDITEDDLGRAIGALVNSEAGQGLVVVRHLRSPRGRLRGRAARAPHRASSSGSTRLSGASPRSCLTCAPSSPP